MMKGQGLSITTIVVAAIALLVLVVLVAVFTNQFGGFAQGTRDCYSLQNAVCNVGTPAKTDSVKNWILQPARRCPETAGEGAQCWSPAIDDKVTEQPRE